MFMNPVVEDCGAIPDLEDKEGEVRVPKWNHTMQCHLPINPDGAA